MEIFALGDKLVDFLYTFKSNAFSLILSLHGDLVLILSEVSLVLKNKFHSFFTVKDFVSSVSQLDFISDHFVLYYVHLFLVCQTLKFQSTELVQVLESIAAKSAS